MLFNSFTYLIFLPFVVALYRLLPQKFRASLLLIASYYFYMFWLPSYGALIFTLTIVNYFLGQTIDKVRDKSQKTGKTLLVAGLIFNLGMLCFFKYTNFLLNSLWNLALFSHNHINIPASLAATSPALNIILPLGISFFTFEFIHYLVDVYKGGKPIGNFWHFALFAAFFPSQIAGPIKRYQDFISQLNAGVVMKKEYFQEGLALIFQGLFKKIALSDNISPIVTSGFANTSQLGIADAWIAAIGFSLQIYFDFSGYTDIGRGSALLFGYKIPINFDLPYLAHSLQNFWHRWHISLSTWLRDYLFIPLGGSRGSEWQTRQNLFLTMALGGLWHGASWTFMIWGILHGIGLIVTRAWLQLVEKSKLLSTLRQQAWWHACGWAFTFLFVVLTFVVFRAENISIAWSVIEHMFSINMSSAASGKLVYALATSTLPLAFILYSLYFALNYLGDILTLPIKIKSDWQASMPAQLAGYTAVALLILALSPGTAAPFIYFQF